MFLTAAAQNLLCMKLATEVGVAITSPWMAWFKIAFAPAAVGLLITPLIVYKLVPPEIKDTPEAPQQAAERLEKMGTRRSGGWGEWGGRSVLWGGSAHGVVVAWCCGSIQVDHVDCTTIVTQTSPASLFNCNPS